MENSDTKNIVLNLTYDDEYNPLYTMPAYFGSDEQGDNSAFLLDTTTPFVAITSNKCHSCQDGGLFNTKKSKTFVEIGDPKNPESITFAEMEVEGYWGKDTVKLKSDSSSLVVDDFEFFVITSV